MSHTPPPGVRVTPDPDEPKPAPYPELTKREFEVARALATGITSREIAREMSISIKTVDTHRMHLLKKLGCKHNVDLARRLIRDGVVRP